jgi:hypothetical protein
MNLIQWLKSTTAPQAPIPVSAADPLPVAIFPPSSTLTPTNATLGGSTKAVAAAGTPEALGVGTCRGILIFPLRTNTGDAFIGASAANDSQHGEVPVAIDAPAGKVLNLADIYVDVTVNGEGVGYITLN